LDGRGTLQGKMMGVDPDGRQLAVQEIQCSRVRDGKIVEFIQHKIGMFENEFEEPINAPAELLEARAEQGGSIESKDVIERRKRLLDAYTGGNLSAAELSAGLDEIYCAIHSEDVDPVHNI
jgi:hypothetical protein